MLYTFLSTLNNGKYEEDYQGVIKKYDKVELELFQEMFVELVNTMGDKE
ncbi:MAG: hypothetical protein LBU27_06020 [Candidatus Peribacteria bacterium]|nr:hypothetical protein [Candidatus Peribacteria bacterium]